MCGEGEKANGQFRILGPSVMRKAFAIVCLILTVFFFFLQATEIRHGFPLFFLCAAAAATVSVFIGRRIVRIIGILLLLLATAGALWEFKCVADFKVRMAYFAEFSSSARNLHKKIQNYCLAHPSESFSGLDDYMRRGVLTTEDVAFLRDAKVICYPFMPNGTDGDTLIEIWQGKRRTLVSQEGGVFSYNASKIKYIGSSPGPSKSFVDTVNREYPGTIPTPAAPKK